MRTEQGFAGVRGIRTFHSKPKMRKLNRRWAARFHPAPPAPNEQALATERATAVRAAVGKLPEDLREAIVLCEWEERSVAEAVTILKTTPKAVESRLYRARQILRGRLKSWL
jgi:RNA polymerase sigma-70 factor (ECF subfamily)